MQPTIFKRIIDKEIPASIVFEDEHCLAFKDVAPQAPVHLLVIPKITDLSCLGDAQMPAHQNLLGHILCMIPKIAAQAGLTDYRVITNNGSQAGQSVFHLHFHILGGRPLAWPPG